MALAGRNPLTIVVIKVPIMFDIVHKGYIIVVVIDVIDVCLGWRNWGSGYNIMRSNTRREETGKYDKWWRSSSRVSIYKHAENSSDIFMKLWWQCCVHAAETKHKFEGMSELFSQLVNQYLCPSLFPTAAFRSTSCNSLYIYLHTPEEVQYEGKELTSPGKQRKNGDQYESFPTTFL